MKRSDFLGVLGGLFLFPGVMARGKPKEMDGQDSLGYFVWKDTPPEWLRGHWEWSKDRPDGYHWYHVNKENY